MGDEKCQAGVKSVLPEDRASLKWIARRKGSTEGTGHIPSAVRDLEAACVSGSGQRFLFEPSVILLGNHQ